MTVRQKAVREAATPVMPRQGPRPMALHLAVAMATSMSSLAVLPIARNGSLNWDPALDEQAATISRLLSAAEPGAVVDAVAAESQRRLAEMLAGIQAYQAHPYRRNLADAPVVWREGSTRLLDYGGASDAPAVLFVPSLVNRAYILDLSVRRSLLRWLAANGVRPLLVDWTAPGPDERDFDLTDYIAGRLERALDAAIGLAGGPVGLVGYCMGGNLALALALRRSDDLTRLALLATPWDFQAELGPQARLLAALEEVLDDILAAFGELPVDILQAMFAGLDPNLAARKFRRFARLDPGGKPAGDFVALEDWLNDGVPLVSKVARECLVGWYGRNAPLAGEWRIAGEPVAPERLTLPALLAMPADDRIVPPASAQALADRLPRATTISPRAGHIGMVTGSRAKRALWRPLRDWLVSGA